MLTLHHLGVSQSERIVWLCEELNLTYDLKIYKRDPLLSPPALKQLPGNDIGTAPVLQDGDVTLTESGAIVEWLIHRHGDGRLAVRPGAPNYAEFLRWWHFANASLQSHIQRTMTLTLAGVDAIQGIGQRTWERLYSILHSMDSRLSKATYLAGDDLTAADIMTVFSLSTMRYFCPFSLGDYPHIVRYLGTISEREAYKRAMERGDPGMKLLMSAEPPEKTMFEMVGMRQAEKEKEKEQQQQQGQENQ